MPNRKLNKATDQRDAMLRNMVLHSFGTASS